jgi:hypothetical protein
LVTRQQYVQNTPEILDQTFVQEIRMKRVKNTSEVRKQTHEGKQENMFQIRLMTSRNVANACEVSETHNKYVQTMRQDGEEGVIFTKQYTCLYSAFNEAVVCEIRRKDANIRANYA